MFYRAGWLKAGVASVALISGIMCVSLLLCRPSPSDACNQLSFYFDLINTPARFASQPALHWISVAMGVRRLGPDLVAAPPGVSTTLQVLSWLAFFIYWFIVGVGVYWMWRLVRRLALIGRGGSHTFSSGRS